MDVLTDITKYSSNAIIHMSGTSIMIKCWDHETYSWDQSILGYVAWVIGRILIHCNNGYTLRVVMHLTHGLVQYFTTSTIFTW